MKKIIHENAFTSNTNLEVLEINSGGSLTEAFQLFSNNPNLRLNLSNNSFTDHLLILNNSNLLT